jgi:PST family polysaccharide transporter
LIGLLLAGPGVLATVTIAPLAITLVYSASFAGAVGILRWICLGAALQVITWPMGFILVAKGRPALFFAAELAWTLVALTLSWFCVKRYGLTGAGVAFFASYIFHWILINPIARSLTGFRWSADNRKIGSLFLALIALVFGSFFILPMVWAVIIGILLTIAGAVCSASILLTMIPLERIPASVRKPLGSIRNYFGGRRLSLVKR